MADLNVKVGLDRSGFQTGLAAMENAATGFGRNLGGILAGAFSFTAITQQFSAALSQAGRLQDLSDSFGVSAESLQRIGNAAAESGGSIEDVGRALARLGVNAQQAFNQGGQLAESFAAIGVTGQDLIRLSPEQIFYRLAAAMNDGSLAGKDLAVAKELLGRGFATLMPVLKMTEEQIRAVGEAAGIMSDDAVAKLDQFGDSWGRLSNTVKVRAAEIIDASIRLGEEIMANPMSLFGDWQQIEKRIEERQRRDKEARDALRTLKPEDAADSAQNAKALEDLISEFKKTARDRERRMDDEDHADKMRKAEELLAKIDEQNRAREQARRTLRESEDLRAQIGGPQAEFALLSQRAAADAARAKQSGDMEDTRAALESQLRLQQFAQGSLRSAGFGEQEAFARAQKTAAGIVGQLPQFSDTARAMEMNTNNRPVQEPTVQNINIRMGEALQKLDELIKKTEGGVFTL